MELVWTFSNPNITMEIVEKYPDKPWDWYEFSYNPNITMEIVEKYPDKPWNWYGFHVIQISLWKLLKNIQINHGIGTEFSYNPNITMEIVEKYPDKPWDWY